MLSAAWRGVDVGWKSDLLSRGGLPCPSVFDRLVSLVIAMSAGLLYFLTLAHVPTPGPWTAALSAGVGLSERTAVGAPVWTALVDMLFRLPGGAFVLRVHMLSAVLGAASVGLMHALMLRFLLAGLDGVETSRARGLTGIRLGALGGALAFMLFPPVWLASTRSHPVMLGLTFFLLCAYALLRCAETGRTGWCFAAGAAAGLCVIESPVAWLPVAGMLIVFMVWVALFSGISSLKSLLRFLPLFVVALLMGFWSFLHNLLKLPVETAGQSWWRHALTPWRDAFSVGSSYGGGVWLVVALLPFLSTFRLTPGLLNGYVGIGHVFSLGVVLALIGAHLFLFGWEIVSDSLFAHPGVAVWTCMMMAWAYGCILAYGYVGVNEQLSRSRRQRGAHHDGREPWRACLPGACIALLLFLLLSVAGLVTRHAVSGRRFDARQAELHRMLDASEGARWVFTDGSCDHALALMARDRGMEAIFIDLNRPLNSPGMINITESLPDARSRALAQIDGFALVLDWLLRDAAYLSRTAILVDGSLWDAAMAEEPRSSVLNRAAALRGSRMLGDGSLVLARTDESLAPVFEHDAAVSSLLTSVSLCLALREGVSALMVREGADRNPGSDAASREKDLDDLRDWNDIMDALYRNQRDADALWRFGRMLAAAGTLEDADRYLLRALEGGAPEPAARLDRIVVQVGAGDIESAMVALNVLKARFPGSGDVWFILAQMAVLREDRDALTQALFTLSRGRVARDGDNMFCRLLRGQNAALRGDIELLDAVWEEWSEADPETLWLLDACVDRNLVRDRSLLGRDTGFRD